MKEFVVANLHAERRYIKMGTDIHGGVIAKHKNPEHYGDNFYLYAIFSLPRWYEWFGHLAGVRYCDIEPVTPLRGSIEHLQISIGDRFDIYGDHSAGWVTEDELLKSLHRAEQGIGHVERDQVSAVLTYIQHLTFC